MHRLPLDRLTMFSRNVFCGATSPLLPPAMVILPAARGPGGVLARLLTAAGNWTRGPQAVPARSAPCAPGDPQAGLAAPSGCYPGALFAPPSLRPASLCTRAGLGSLQPPPGGRREQRRLDLRRPLPGSCPRRPAGDQARAPAAAGKRRAAAGQGWDSSATLWAQPGNVFRMRLGLGGQEGIVSSFQGRFTPTRAPQVLGERGDVTLLCFRPGIPGPLRLWKHLLLPCKHFGRLMQANHLRSGVRDQPSQHGEMLSLLKIQNLARLGGRSRTLSPRLEYSGAISAHYNLHLPGSKTGFHHVGQAGLELLTSSSPPTSASQSPDITDLLRKLRQESCLNLGDVGCSKLRLHDCTPAWVTEIQSKKKKERKKKKKANDILKKLLGRLRQENHLNLGGGDCSELRSCHYTPAWETERDSVSKIIIIERSKMAD
ncbi:hypothetical protein AAY473_021097 [Plecturocebus cupreus]